VFCHEFANVVGHPHQYDRGRHDVVTECLDRVREGTIYAQVGDSVELVEEDHDRALGPKRTEHRSDVIGADVGRQVEGLGDGENYLLVLATNVSASGRPAHEALPGVHLLFSLGNRT
jgi:hypothetical protein